jgi:hypothetical protein
MLHTRVPRPARLGTPPEEQRDALRESCNAQIEAQRALTDAERARAERAEAQLEAERADRRQLTTRITSNGSPPAQRSGARSK